jgi:hypothetical protein
VPRKNYKKIPRQILDRINAIDVDDVIVACVKRVAPEDVRQYVHLNLQLQNGTLVLPPPTVPSETSGRYSHINVHGKEVVRRDLPKVLKTVTIDSPNWGDWSNGSHEVSWTREVYERGFIPPKELTLSVELVDTRDNGEFLVKFAIDQVLRKTADDIEDELLYNLNILQENVGAVSVFASTATLEDFRATIRLAWEILPPGTVDDTLKRILAGKPPVLVEKQSEMRERLQLLRQLKPRNYVAGTNEFLRYFGALFEDDLVVFENLNYGNAAYIMYENWEALSQRSRVDLLKGPRDGFHRVPHSDGWEDRLAGLVRRHRERPRT